MSQRLTAVAVNLQIPRWITAFAILATFLLLTGAGISLLAPERLLPPGAEISSAVKVYAAYTFSRDLGLAIVLCLGLMKGSRSILLVMMGLFALINGCDAIMDVIEARLPVFVIAFLLSLIAAIAWARLSKASALSVR
jgi:hypothetical protein